MASFTIGPSPLFPPGATVGAYEADRLPFAPSGPPGPAAVTTAVAASSGAIAFTGLTAHKRYFAAADVGGAWRYLAFTAGEDQPATGGPVLADRSNDLTGDNRFFGTAEFNGPVDLVDATITGLSSGDLSDLASLATQAELDAHAADTTGQHGIADTAALETQAGAAAKVSAHEADATAVHGIADTAALALTANVALRSRLPVNVKDHGAVGDGVADDTAAIQAAQAALPATGGVVFFPPGVYKVTATLTVGNRQQFVGSGKGEVTDNRGATSIISSFNGVVISVPATSNGWAIRDLAISGDRTQAAQDLLSLGQTQQGQVQRVTVQQAGRDNVVLAATLNVHFDTCYFHSAKRNNLRSSGQANANKFTKCLFRVADEWGINWGGGTDCHFDNCTIESNSLSSAAAFGGLRIDPNDADVSANCSLILTSCHFENNRGNVAGNTGVPIRVEAGPRFAHLTEIGTLYSESNASVFNSGRVASVGITTNVGPHAIIAAAVVSSWLQPTKFGGGSFTLTDNSALTFIAAGDLVGGQAAVKFGSVMSLARHAASGHILASGKLLAASGLGVGNSAAASTLGSVTRKIEVFDDTGVSMGFIPVYGSIT